MRLSNGDLFPIPITLDVSEKFRSKIKRGEKITFRDKEGFPLAILTISDIWKPDLLLEAELVYGSVDHRHPAVNFLLNKGHKYYVGGKLDGLSLPRHFSFLQYRHTPEQLKLKFRELGWEKIIAFQTRNPLHGNHIEMTKRSINDLNANLLLHPVTGLTKAGDINYFQEFDTMSML